VPNTSQLVCFAEINTVANYNTIAFTTLQAMQTALIILLCLLDIGREGEQERMKMGGRPGGET